MDWNTIPTDDVINLTAKNLKERGMDVIIVDTKEEAFAKLKEIIPEEAEVMTGASQTLHQIGFSDFLQSDESKYKNLNAEIWAEDNEAKRGDLRRKAVTAEYFLASPNAISANGEVVSVDKTGSRTGAMPFAAKHLILVSGVNKITDNLDSAFKRVREFVFPLENSRSQKAYNMPSAFGKWVIIEHEINPNRIKVILIKEVLGF